MMIWRLPHIPQSLPDSRVIFKPHFWLFPKCFAHMNRKQTITRDGIIFHNKSRKSELVCQVLPVLDHPVQVFHLLPILDSVLRTVLPLLLLQALWEPHICRLLRSFIRLNRLLRLFLHLCWRLNCSTSLLITCQISKKKRGCDFKLSWNLCSAWVTPTT